MVPSAISRLYTPEVLTRLAGVQRPASPREDAAADSVRQRHIIFSGEALAGHAMRARRAAWWSYLEHAAAVGLLDEDDLRQRLVDVDDENFRGALAECLVSWFFSTRLGVELRRHGGDGGRHADFEGPDDLHVEGKAPYVPVPGKAWSGDDTAVLRHCIQNAGGQFKKNMVNVMVVVPLLRTPVWMQPDQLVKATIGEWAMVVPVSHDPASPAAPRTMRFLQRGKLAQLHEGGTRTHLTRVSAVACIEEETMLGKDGVVLHHYVHVVHNPFAAKPLPPAMFGDRRQLVVSSPGEMTWVGQLGGG
jgi:hypothetical protein